MARTWLQIRVDLLGGPMTSLSRRRGGSCSSGRGTRLATGGFGSSAGYTRGGHNDIGPDLRPSRCCWAQNGACAQSRDTFAVMAKTTGVHRIRGIAPIAWRYVARTWRYAARHPGLRLVLGLPRPDEFDRLSASAKVTITIQALADTPVPCARSRVFAYADRPSLLFGPQVRWRRRA